jgi:hypothetical protein
MINYLTLIRFFKKIDLRQQNVKSFFNILLPDHQKRFNISSKVIVWPFGRLSIETPYLINNFFHFRLK